MHPNYQLSKERREIEEFQEREFGQGAWERKLNQANATKLDPELEEALIKEEEAEADAFWQRMYEQGEITWNPAEL